MTTENTPSMVTINEDRVKRDVSNNNSNGSSTKAFAGVFALLLVISGVYSMMKPMNQNLDYMDKAIERLRIEFKVHENVLGHTGQVQQEASSQARFEEIKTQFCNLKEIMEIRDTSQTKEIDKLEARLSASLLEIARLQERIKIKSTN